MSRVTITVDSATPAEIYELTLQFQRTSRVHALPPVLTPLPTVTVVGDGMTWTSPPLSVAHARAMLEQDRG